MGQPRRRGELQGAGHVGLKREGRSPCRRGCRAACWAAAVLNHPAHGVARLVNKIAPPTTNS